MELNCFKVFIKLLIINISICMCFNKLICNYSNTWKTKKTIILICNISITFIQYKLCNYISPFYILFPLAFVYSFIFMILYRTEKFEAFIASIISLSITCIVSLFTTFISSLIYASLCVLFNHFNLSYHTELYYISTLFMAFISLYCIVLLFKIPKLKYGFTFLKNDYIKLQILLATIIIIFAYSVLRDYSRNYLLLSFVIISLLYLIAIKQVFILYQKQKLQMQTLKDYEKELSDIKEELRITKEEKEKIIKSNHEFYHRQEALKAKLNNLANSNSEFSDEISSITSRINNLSNEYENKVKTSTKIETFGVEELDDMLIYFQEECNKNNINFICKIEGNVHKLINNIISVSEFETLIGDLLRNAIIAINHSTNTGNSIMLAFGLKDNNYELDIYDSGIEFKIETLMKLGLEKCSTHLDDGGTGIGFITTFETLQNTKSSLIITEMNSGNYSKCIGIRFDNLNQYVINSYRKDLIANNNVANRNIVLQ